MPVRQFFSDAVGHEYLSRLCGRDCLEQKGLAARADAVRVVAAP